MSARDVIVIGAGHNGLTAAALLAKRGRRVTVVEQGETVGGLAGRHEFHPGYHSAGVLQDTSCLSATVVESLGLTSYGLKLGSLPPVFVAQSQRPGMLFYQDSHRAEPEIAKHSEKDALCYRQFRAFVDRVKPIVLRYLEQVPPRVLSLELRELFPLLGQGLAIRRLGKRDMTTLMRLGPMCLADWLNEWFESDVLKVALAGPAIVGTYLGPWSPGSATNLLLKECAAWRAVHGGPQALIAALHKCADAQGVVIHTNSEAQRILLQEGHVVGVELADGQVHQARTIIATCDPKRTMLSLLPPESLSPAARADIVHIRTRGTTAVINLALSRAPELPGPEHELCAHMRIGDDLDALEQAFDVVKYRQYSHKPYLEVFIPSTEDSTLAPHGHAVMSIMFNFAAVDLADGWSEQHKQCLADIAIDVVERHVKGLRSSVLASEVLSPVDLEARYGLTGGHIHHGEHALDQLLIRPSPGCQQFRTPVSGLYLGGSGSHPGGGITCRPGLLAATAVSKNGH